MSHSDALPTGKYLLPGQQFCIGLPWERDGLPEHGLPPLPPQPLPGNTLDDSSLKSDPCAGWEIGSCEVIRRLSPGSVKSLLALRRDANGVETLVVLKKLEVD